MKLATAAAGVQPRRAVAGGGVGGELGGCGQEWNGALPPEHVEEITRHMCAQGLFPKMNFPSDVWPHARKLLPSLLENQNFPKFHRK